MVEHRRENRVTCTGVGKSMRSALLSVAVLVASVALANATEPELVKPTTNEESVETASPRHGALIDFRDRQSVEVRRPIIIAHRGGVVSPKSPECSATAIRLAAEQGYDMVELDVQVSKDGVPIVFHDRTLATACGKEGQVADYTAADLGNIQYKASNDRIGRLDSALKLCRELHLGVMLDLKAGRDSERFLLKLKGLLEKHQLVHSSITFSGSKTARRVLQRVRFTPTDEEMRRLRAGEKLDLGKRFWFGLPKQLQAGDVEKLKAAGALVIPAINTFRYPAENHLELAKADVRRLIKEGVDGFQIDSVYHTLFDSGQ